MDCLICFLIATINKLLLLLFCCKVLFRHRVQPCLRCFDVIGGFWVVASILCCLCSVWKRLAERSRERWYYKQLNNKPFCKRHEIFDPIARKVPLRASVFRFSWENVRPIVYHFYFISLGLHVSCRRKQFPTHPCSDHPYFGNRSLSRGILEKGY